MAKLNLFLLSGRCIPKLLKIVFTFKFHPLHAKISTPTGTAVPDEKSKKFPWMLPFWELDGTEITELILNAYHSAKQSILNRTKSTVEFQGLGHLGPHMGARGKALDPRITPGFRTSGFPALISVGGANRFLEDLSPNIPRDWFFETVVEAKVVKHDKLGRF